MSTTNKIINVRNAAIKADAKYDAQEVEVMLGNNPYRCPTYKALSELTIDGSNVFLISGSYSNSKLVKYDDVSVNVNSDYTVTIATTIVNTGQTASLVDAILYITIDCYDNNRNYINTIYIRGDVGNMSPNSAITDTHDFINQQVGYVQIRCTPENINDYKITVNGYEYNGDFHQLYISNPNEPIINTIIFEFS